MNKVLYIFLLSFVMANTLLAQKKTIRIKAIRLGLGTNLYSLSKSPKGATSKTGVGFQFVADTDVLSFKRRYSLQLGLQYTQANIRLEHPSLTDKNSNVILSGIKIPLLLSRSWNYSPSSNIRFFTGPSFMVVTNVKHKNINDPLFMLTDKNFHDVEWAWQFGIRHEIRSCFIDIGYQQGLTYVLTDGSNGRSNMVYLNIGVVIRGNSGKQKIN